MPEQTYVATCYLEIDVKKSIYTKKPESFRVTKVYQNEPSTPVGKIIKVTVRATESFLMPPEVNIDLEDSGIVSAIEELKEWTASQP